MKKLYLFAIATAMIMAASCKKDSAPQVKEGPYFPHVKMIIEQNCVTCHYYGGQGMPIILTSDSAIINYAESIKAATTDSVTPFNRRMPLGSELSDSDKTTIINWFDAGGTAKD